MSFPTILHDAEISTQMSQLYIVLDNMRQEILKYYYLFKIAFHIYIYICNKR